MPAPATASDRPSPLERVLPPLALIAAILVVWNRSLDLYFSQDDWVALARASGLAPRLEGTWRVVSAQLLFDLLRPVAGLSSRAYHAASLALHAACALVLYTFLARPLGRPAALVGAAFYALHAALFTAVYWIAAIGDPLACLLTLLAATAWRTAQPRRWLAAPLYALALLAKESAIPLPLALLALPRDADAGAAGNRLVARARDPLWLTLAALAALQVLGFARAGAMGSGGASPAYALGSGADLWKNALTYLGWTLNAWMPTVRSFFDAQDPLVWAWGVAAALLWLLGLSWPELRRRGWLAAGAWYVAFLLPYLPLASHTYHYYLYLPLAGAAACVAIAAGALFERLGRPAARWAVALALMTVLAANSYLLVRRIETAPFTLPGHRSDPIVDRAMIARRMVESVRRELPEGESVRLSVWTLAGAGQPASGGYFERNLKTALYDGLALRVMLPQVQEVRFTDHFERLDGSWRWVLARSTGDARVLAADTLEAWIQRHGPPR